MMPENLLDKEYTVCAIGSCHCVTHIMFFRDVTPCSFEHAVTFRKTLNLRDILAAQV